MTSVVPANQEIEQVVVDEWNRTPGGPLLISKLGMRLSSETKATISNSGFGLKRYVQQYLSDVVRFVPMRGRGGGVAPLSQTAGLTDLQIEERYVDRPEAGDLQNAIPIYWGDIWRGFQTPLPDGHVRYVLLEAHGSPEVGTSSKDAQLPVNAKLIDQNDLVLPNSDGSLPPRAAVHQSIENWCRREGVPVTSLLFTRSSPKRVDAPASTHSPHFSMKSEKGIASSLGLNLLTREELARISIPADLVLAMLARAGSR